MATEAASGPMLSGPSPETLRRLGARRNGPALLHALIQFSAFGFLAMAAARLGALGHPAAWVGLETVPGFAYVLLAWPIAHLGLGLYLMTEHTGLANRGSQFQRTRSTRSNAAIRWLMWNMPYHAEHHAFPAIPFHALPALHTQCNPLPPHTATGYAAFHREAIRRSLQPGQPAKS